MKLLQPALGTLLLVLLSVCIPADAGASEEGENLRAADAALNSSYRVALEAMPDAATKSRLREAQRAWVAFRDAEIALRGSIPGASGNILKMYQTELTDERTKQLKDLTEVAR